VLREYCDDGRLLLASKSLYSCSEVYIRVGGIKSQPFTVSVRLRQWCVLSPLFLLLYISYIQPKFVTESNIMSLF